jgi:hypothetical protein
LSHPTALIKDLDAVKTLSGSHPAVALSPLAATFTNLPVNIANKRLTSWLKPLDATLTKNRGGGAVIVN